ncbi:MAG: NAD(P)-binding domain-containing protein [bacterium]|nr:NAD(P)-binding domain-containing protein [bacterium]
MTWTVLVGVVFALGFSLFATLSRRAELARMRAAVHDWDRAAREGAAKAQLQHPVVDLSRCLGCATCVAACPEKGVLELVHGQAMVVGGARCVGVSACERECPVGAITVTIADLEERTDIPVLSAVLEAVETPGLFLAGEVTAHALIKTAIEHGTAVASEVVRRTTDDEPDELEHDLVIVGAGPAGLACSLEAKRHGLSFVTLEQAERVGGTVAKYPRRKLVLTRPVELPLHGRLASTSYSKEELMQLWEGVVREHELPIRTGEVLVDVERRDDGRYLVRTETSSFLARNVCLALGRRGTPRKLEVPGEELPKVAYSLLDAQSFQNRRVLVVGGGDSAVEAAMGLAEQPGNDVILSYRKPTFFRVKARNEERLAECVARGKLRVVTNSEVLAIHPTLVELAVVDGQGIQKWTVANDDVFVMTGGVLAIELLERSGVSFDSSLRADTGAVYEQGSGLSRALGAGFVLALIALLWAAWHADYYILPSAGRPAHLKHDALRSSQGAGLWLGIASAALICVNLAYLVRRSPRFRFELGSLQSWMTSHVATGILALLCAMMHGAMAPGDTVGGHAFWALFALLVTGAIGRYFYAWVPRAANGRELALDEAKLALEQVASEWDPNHRAFSERARDEVFALIEQRQWRASFLGRVLALLGLRIDLRRTLSALVREGERQGIPQDKIGETMHLARRAYHTTLMVAHYEDVRAVLNTWRYFHRWGAALMVSLVVVHIVSALVYGVSFGGAQ